MTTFKSKILYNQGFFTELMEIDEGIIFDIILDDTERMFAVLRAKNKITKFMS